MNRVTILLNLLPSNNPRAITRLDIDGVEFEWLNEQITDTIYASFDVNDTDNARKIAAAKGDAIARALAVTLDIGTESVRVHRIENTITGNITLDIQGTAHLIRDDLSTQDIDSLSRAANSIIGANNEARIFRMTELYRRSLGADNEYAQFWLLYAILQIEAATLPAKNAERRKVDKLIRSFYSDYTIKRDPTPTKRGEKISKITATRDLFSHTDGSYEGQILTVDDLISGALPKLRDVAKRIIFASISNGEI